MTPIENAWYYVAVLAWKRDILSVTKNPLTHWSGRLIRWLGDLDSNQDWRSQSPLSYR
jgi:hypothetical protein